MRNLWLQPQQAFECRGGAGFCARLEQLAQQHQSYDRRAGLEVDVLLMQSEHGDDRAECPGHCRAKGDQDVHVGATATQRVPRPDIESAADPELHWGSERELPLAWNEVRVRRAAEPARRQHRHHLREQRQRQDHRQDDFPSERLILALLARLVVCSLRFRFAPDARAVACARDRRDQLVSGCSGWIEVDCRDFSGEIDRGMRAGNAVQDFFDARRAGRAGHSGQAEFEPVLRRSRASRRGKGTCRSDRTGIHGTQTIPIRGICQDTRPGYLRQRIRMESAP